MKRREEQAGQKAKRQRLLAVVQATRKRQIGVDWEGVDDVRSDPRGERVTSGGLVGELEAFVLDIEFTLPTKIYSTCNGDKANGMTNGDKANLHRVNWFAREFLQWSQKSGGQMRGPLHLCVPGASGIGKYIIDIYGKLQRLVTSLRELGLVAKAYDMRQVEQELNILFRRLVVATTYC